jgi:hypothetical protein
MHTLIIIPQNRPDFNFSQLVSSLCEFDLEDGAEQIPGSLFWTTVGSIIVGPT